MPRRLRRRIRRRPRRRLRKRIPRSLAPASKVIKCNVVETFSPTYAAGALNLACNIQGNSIDDPFSGGSSQQPLGYDQWKAFYKKAKVLGCKVFTEWHNGSTGAVICGVTAFGKTQGLSALSSHEYYIESPGTKHKLLSPDVDKCIITSKRSTKKMLKITNVKDNTTTELDLITETAPTDLYYFHVWSQPFDQTTALTGVQVLVKVEYIVLLYDPLIPARSVET